MVIYQTKETLLSDLKAELKQVEHVCHNLVFSSVSKQVCFALDIWYDAKIIPFQSISEAVKILRNKNKYWALNPIEHFRRSQLILSELKQYKIDFHFPMTETIPEIGVFSLLDKNTLVCATKRLKQVPGGEYPFIEDKKNPPNRAYLKLWEALTLCRHLPKKNEVAMDLGASPGGWTYVMQSLGARVISVDKAELEPKIAKLPGVKFLKNSAFALEPRDFDEPIDWLICDVACYPMRTYALAIKWIESGKAKRLIFTIKLQGKTDLAAIQRFQEIPNSHVMHLFNNKHEATFFYPDLI